MNIQGKGYAIKISEVYYSLGMTECIKIMIAMTTRSLKQLNSGKTL